MAYRVLKPIQSGDGTTIATGELVEAGGWRNLRQLVNGRYLVEVIDSAASDEAPTPKRKPKKVADTDAEATE